MKATILLVVVACLQVNASTIAQKITLSGKDMPLEKVFKEIRNQSGYELFYRDDVIQKVPLVSIEVKNATIDEAMQQCLKGLPLSYEIVEKIIVIKPSAPSLQSIIPLPPPTEVEGVITDEFGTPVANASIGVKGTSYGVTSDANGKFHLKSTQQDITLVISSVGYQTQELKIKSNDHNIVIKLKTAETALKDVVIIGYGTQKKENLTGSIAAVSGKELESRPLVNLAQGLQGLVPNLNINMNSGRPGQEANFNIRGVTSINSGNGNLGSPLVMVDGIQMDPNLINPADIESVTVLKDAASSAIYGSRGAYGVILINTKNGKKNMPLRVNYSGSYTISKPTRLPKYLNAVDYIAMHREADRNGQLSGGWTASMPFTEEDSIMAAKYFADPANNPSGYPDPSNPSKYRYVGNEDWVREMYPNWRPQQQHNISVAGGADKTSFIASLGYFDQKGMLNYSNENYQRINPSLKVTTEATSWLSLNFKTTLNHLYHNAPTAPTNGNSNSYIQGDARPNMPVYNPGGTDFSGQGSWTNSVAVMLQNGRDKTTANDIWATGGIVISPVKNVKINADYTYNNYAGFEQKVQKQFPEYGVDHAFLNYYPWTYPDATTEISNNNNYNVVNVFGNYENTFKGSHYFKVTIGYNQEHRHFKTINSYAKNLIDPGTPFIGLNSDEKPSITGYEYEWAMNGLLYRLNYAYRNKYLLEVDGRYDGSSSFPSGHRYVWSPSASIGWKISEEVFFEPLKSTIDELKLRLNYGQLPNQMFDPSNPSDATVYPYIALMSNGKTNYIFGNQQSIYIGSPNSLVSPNFTWETVITKGAGIDFSLLQRRLSGSFDWYMRDTKNMLVNGQPLPAVLGVAPPLQNAADLRTKGWELSLNYHDQIGKDFTYSVGLGLSDYTAKITKYNLNPDKIVSSYYVGQKFGEIWGLVTDGYFKTDEEGAAYDQSQLDKSSTEMAGDIKYKDLNKDGHINYGDNTVSNPGDRKIIGNSTPRYQYGINLSAKYKGFDLAIFFQGVGKRDYMPGDNAFWGFQSEWSVPYVYMKDHWTPNNTNAYFPRLRFGGGTNFETQTKYLQNAAYCRLKNVSVGYSISPSVINRIKLKTARIYITGQNLFEITKMFKAYDPETIGFGTYPLSRSVSFGLQLGL